MKVVVGEEKESCVGEKLVVKWWSGGVIMGGGEQCGGEWWRFWDSNRWLSDKTGDAVTKHEDKVTNPDKWLTNIEEIVNKTKKLPQKKTILVIQSDDTVTKNFKLLSLKPMFQWGKGKAVMKVEEDMVQSDDSLIKIEHAVTKTKMWSLKSTVIEDYS